VKKVYLSTVVAGVLAAGLPVLPALADESPSPTPSEKKEAPMGGAPAAPEKKPEQKPDDEAGPGGSAGSTQPPAPDTRDPRDILIDKLLRTVDRLEKRVDELEKKQSCQPVPAGSPAAGPAPGPTGAQPESTSQDPAPPAGNARPSATLLPNISVVGNIIARGGDTRAIPGRGRSHFEELEVAFQDAIAPKLRYDVILAAEKEEEWGVELEEGYITATALIKNLNARVGRMRAPFGKFNPLHPHQWLFITQPSAHTALVGDHGLITDGAVLQYLLPLRGLYGAVEVGRWETTGIHGHEEGAAHAARLRRFGKDHEEGEEEEEGHEEFGFRGGELGAYSARLHLGKALGRDRELELGVSRYWGRGEVEGFRRRDLALNGIDLSYRSYPGAYRRIWLLGELLAHETRGIHGDTKFRPGAFLMAAYRWNRYWEAGVRGDYTKFPFPVDGKEWGASLFLTRYLNEQTSLRLEYRHEKDVEFGSGNGVFFQVIFGSGPHAHPLQ
jgi:hypothetical protein